MKPTTAITVSWGASTPNSGTLSAYELRYTTDNGATYTTVSTSISTSNRTYTFTPNVRENDTLKVQVCARNSYGKKSSYATFNSVTIYADGASVGKLSGAMKHLRGYVKVGGTMYKVRNIRVKINGVIHTIDQYAPPRS